MFCHSEASISASLAHIHTHFHLPHPNPQRASCYELASLTSQTYYIGRGISTENTEHRRLTHNSQPEFLKKSGPRHTNINNAYSSCHHGVNYPPWFFILHLLSTFPSAHMDDARHYSQTAPDIATYTQKTSRPLSCLCCHSDSRVAVGRGARQ